MDSRPISAGGLSDEELAGRFAGAGETGCFEELVHRHTGKVRAMVYPMVLNDADADDVTQEVFLRVFRGLRDFRGDAGFSTWLFRIVMNTTHTFLKRRARASGQALEDVQEPRDERTPAPGSSLGTEELDREIEAALAALSPSLRAAVMLIGLHGLDPAEAARAEGCPRATMYWRLHEARRILKGRLKRYLAS